LWSLRVIKAGDSTSFSARLSMSYEDAILLASELMAASNKNGAFWYVLVTFSFYSLLWLSGDML